MMRAELAGWRPARIGAGYGDGVIVAVLGAPGSGKSTVVPLLKGLLPGHVVLDWDAFMMPASVLAGREIRQHPPAWPGYRELVRAAIAAVGHLPVVLLGVCTPAQLAGWPIDAWVLLDCADHERRRRLAGSTGPDTVRDAVRDGREYRSLGLPVIDTAGRRPAAVAAELTQFVHQVNQGPTT
jgi:energy-coupling factor transporter ATP-binding protein EcfA2